MATKPKADQDTANERPAAAPEPATVAPRVPAARIKGAYQLGGVWYAADHTPLTAVETQQAHRAADKAAAEAKRKALLGGGA